MISKNKMAALREDLNAYCEKNHIFGVLRITQSENIVLEQNFGYADLETKRPFTKDSLFSLYSLSKPFCVLGLMKLCDKGLVDLDAHPSRYIPEAEGLDARVRIRHALHHTSGLPDFGQNKEFAEAHKPGTPERMREHLRLISAYPQYFAPGADTRYANVNMVLAALIIENVSGLSYAEYMQKEVFDPLGMKHALVDNEHLFHPDRVTGYELIDDEPRKIDRATDWMLGAGDLLGTADDVYALRNAIKDGLLLKKESWQEVLTPSPINDFGMGCRVHLWHGKKCITHNGGHLGFRTLHKYLPDEDFDLIFLSNSGYGSAREDLGEMIFSAFFEKEKGAENEKIEMDKGYI
jgi:CubicO group peptidase (beta-lactamase class C family)